jgi:hypothetical protein
VVNDEWDHLSIADMTRPSVTRRTFFLQNRQNSIRANDTNIRLKHEEKEDALFVDNEASRL